MILILMIVIFMLLILAKIMEEVKAYFSIKIHKLRKKEEYKGYLYEVYNPFQTANLNYLIIPNKLDILESDDNQTIKYINNYNISCNIQIFIYSTLLLILFLLSTLIIFVEKKSEILLNLLK